MICVVEVTQIKALISPIQFHVYTHGDTILCIYVYMYMYMYVYSHNYTDKYIHCTYMYMYNACLYIHYMYIIYTCII